MKTAIIIGITGQDGYYLSSYLICQKKYNVIGLVQSEKRLLTATNEVNNEVILEVWDMQNQENLENILLKYNPCEIYNLAAFSTGEGMYDNPINIVDINGSAVIRILEAIRLIDSKIKFCQASSREVFGLANLSPQDENTRYNPRSPYGVAKAEADFMINIYKEMYNIFACSAILYNHESPRRSINFVTRKITNSAVKIKYNLQEKLFLGNLKDKRDWGFAGDYIEAMWLMLQNSSPKNYVISTGKYYTIGEFCKITFDYLGLNYENYVIEDESLFRKAEPNILVGNSSAIKDDLGWEPKVNLNELIKIMVDYDIEIISKQKDKDVYKN